MPSRVHSCCLESSGEGEERLSMSQASIWFPFLVAPVAGGAAHFLCNLPCLESPESRLLNLTPAIFSLKVSPTLLLVFPRPTSSWPFKSLSTQSGRDLSLLPRWGWDMNVVGAVVRAVQTWPWLEFRILNHTGLSKNKIQTLKCLSSLACFVGRCEIFLNGIRNEGSSRVHFNSNFSYISSVKLTSEGELYWRAICCLDRHIRIKLLCACLSFVWILLELHQ